MIEPRKIRVEIGVPAQIEPGEQVEVESVPGITAHSMSAGPGGGTVEVKPNGGIVLKGISIKGRNADE